MTTPIIRVFFGLASDTYPFTLDHATDGLLDSDFALLVGDTGTEVQAAGYDLQITRGRSRLFDEFTVGTMHARFRNYDRAFDALHTGSPYNGKLKPGKLVQVETYGVRIFEGYAEDWTVAYDRSRSAEASLYAEDALGKLGRQTFNEWTTTAGQLPGARIAAALDRPEIDFPVSRNLDVGISTLQGGVVQWNTNVLNYVQLVARSDLGRVFVSRDGLLTFKDRHGIATYDPEATFSDDGLTFEIPTPRGPFESLSLERDHLYNRVQVDRVGGILQTAKDQASIDEFGERPLPISGLLLDSDTQSLDMANFLLGLYAQPQTRVSSITVQLSSDVYTSRMAASICLLDIGDQVQIITTPLDVGSASTTAAVIEGVTHRLLLDGTHYVTFNLTPITPTQLFELDHDLLGALDTGGLLTF